MTVYLNRLVGKTGSTRVVVAREKKLRVREGYVRVDDFE